MKHSAMKMTVRDQPPLPWHESLPVDVHGRKELAKRLRDAQLGAARPRRMHRWWDAQRGPLTLSLVALAVTLVLLPVGPRQLGPTTSYVPAVLAVVACFDVMSMWLLAGEYADTGDPRMLAMAVAYLWSLTLMAGYALAFPGVISTHPPLAVTPSVAPYPTSGGTSDSRYSSEQPGHPGPSWTDRTRRVGERS